MADEFVKDKSRVWRRIEDALIIVSIGGLWVWFMDWKGPLPLTIRIVTLVVLLVITVKRVRRIRRLRSDL